MVTTSNLEPKSILECQSMLRSRVMTENELSRIYDTSVAQQQTDYDLENFDQAQGIRNFMIRINIKDQLF